MTRTIWIGLTAAAALLTAGPSFAETADAAAQAAASAAQPSLSLDALQPLGEASLQEADGGQQITQAISEQALTAMTTGNSIQANNVGSGAVSFDANAFSGFNGVGNLVINTGHNNTLQGALSVSVVITP